MSIEAPEKVKSVDRIFFSKEKSAWKQYSNDKQQQQILDVGTEVFQDSENIHMGTGNISQIPYIYFVNEFFIQKT